MAIKTVKINSNTLNKITYDVSGRDLTLYLKDGAVFRYLDVPTDIIDNITGLKKDGVSAEKLHSYLFGALTKKKESVTGRGRYRRTENYTISKYRAVQIRESDAQIKARKESSKPETKKKPVKAVKRSLKAFTEEMVDYTAEAKLALEEYIRNNG